MTPLPHAPDAEAYLIGGFLACPQYLDHFPALEPEAFSGGLERAVYSEMRDRRERGETISPLLLRPFVAASDPTLDAPEWIAGCVASTGANPGIGSMEAFVSILNESRLARELIVVARDAQKDASAPDCDASAILEGLTDACAEMAAHGRNERAIPLATSVERLFDTTVPTIIESGLPALDRLSCAPRGKLTVLGGASSMGKSMFAVELAGLYAGRGANVTFVSMEMSAEDIAARRLTSAYDQATENQSIPYRNVVDKKLREAERGALRSIADYLPDFHVFDAPRRTVGNVKAHALANGKPDVVFVDFLTKMSRDGAPDWMRPDQKLGYVCDRLRAFAKLHNCAVILLCQLSRGYTQRDNPVPRLSDLRDSGEIEQFADTVWFCHRRAYYLEREIDAAKANGDTPDDDTLHDLRRSANLFQVVVAKQRMGGLGTANLRCDITTNRIWDEAAEAARVRARRAA